MNPASLAVWVVVGVVLLLIAVRFGVLVARLVGARDRDRDGSRRVPRQRGGERFDMED